MWDKRLWVDGGPDRLLERLAEGTGPEEPTTDVTIVGGATGRRGDDIPVNVIHPNTHLRPFSILELFSGLTLPDKSI